MEERKLWDNYQKCYEDILNKTSKEYAPWFIVPADNKETARYIVAKTILDELNNYTFHYPELDQDIKDNIKTYYDYLSTEK